MKLIQAVKLLTKLRLIFSKPEKKELLIFDDEAIQDLDTVIQDFDYFILPVRPGNLKFLYIHPKILFNFFLNLRYGIVKSYLISIIQLVSPKLIITNIDNSWQFSEIARILNTKHSFFAIQNGARYDFRRYEHQFRMKIYKKNINELFYIPNLFCFGDHEYDEYKKYKIDVKNFYPVGSLRLANFIEMNKINIEKKPKYKFDICLISDSIVLNFDKKFGTTNDVHKMGKFIKYVVRYVRENNKSFICAFAKLNSSKKIFQQELEFYKKYLNEDEYNFLIRNSTLHWEKQKYLTYNAMLKSNISLSAFSTLIREHISIGRKAISINFMSNDIFEFPVDGLCKIKDSSYVNFKNHLDKVLQLDENEYVNNLNRPKKYLMNYDKQEPAFTKIKNHLRRVLDYEKN